MFLFVPRTTPAAPMERKASMEFTVVRTAASRNRRATHVSYADVSRRRQKSPVAIREKVTHGLMLRKTSTAACARGRMAVYTRSFSMRELHAAVARVAGAPPPSPDSEVSVPAQIESLLRFAVTMGQDMDAVRAELLAQTAEIRERPPKVPRGGV